MRTSDALAAALLASAGGVALFLLPYTFGGNLVRLLLVIYLGNAFITLGSLLAEQRRQERERQARIDWAESRIDRDIHRRL